MTTGRHFHLGEYHEAKRLVTTFHYSHSWPAGGEFVATYHTDGGLFGDSGPAIAACVFGQASTWLETVFELTRLARDPDYDVPLSALVAESVRWLKRKQLTDLVVSYADCAQGHHGGVYQACSWNYDGLRQPAKSGLLINGQYVPNRSVSQNYGTGSVELLRQRGLHVERFIDEGKHLYWRALNRKGEAQASRLGLERLPYPKPDQDPGQLALFAG